MLPIRIVPAAAALLLALAGCGAQESDPIRIGVAAPLETTGGRSVQRAVTLAVEEANRRGGIGGRTVELAIRDDRGDPVRAITVATEFRDDPGVAAVIGHVNSSATMAAAGIYNDERNGLVEISPTSSSPQVTEAGPWTFRVSPSDLSYGPAIARWLAGEGARRAAVLYVNDGYGRDLARSFAGAFQQAGGAVVSRDPFLPETLEEAAFAAYLARALRRGMDALMVAGTAEDALRIIPAARRAGYTGPIVGADGLLGIEAMGAGVDGTYLSAAFFSDAPADSARRFVQAYRDRWSEDPNADAALAYDAARVVLRALAEAGPDRRALRDHIAGIGSASAPLQGVTGEIRFDENGDPAEKTVAIGVVRGGRVVMVGS